MVGLEPLSALIGLCYNLTKIHRRNVYDSIEQLKEKAFVSWTVKNNRKYFEAVPPSRIIDIIDEKKEKIQEIIPQLVLKQKMALYPAISNI